MNEEEIISKKVKRLKVPSLFDMRLLSYLIIILIASIFTANLGGAGAFAGLGAVIITTVVFYGLNLQKMFYAFIFIGNYHNQWGGDYVIFSLSHDVLDVHLSQISNFLGFFVVGLIVMGGVKIPRLNKLDLAIFVFFLIAVLSAFVSPFPAFPKAMMPRMFQFFALYMLVRFVIRTKNDLIDFFTFHLTSFIPIFGLLMFQLATGYLNEYGHGRPHTLINFLPYILGISVLKRKSWPAWKSWTLFMLSSFVMTFSASRRIMMGIIGNLGLFLMSNKKYIVYIFPIIFIAVIGYQLVPDYTRERIDYSFQVVQSGDEDEGLNEDQMSSLTSNRSQFWQITFAMFLDYPVLGIGLKNSTEFMVEYGAFRRARAHNFYLEVLADLGIVGISSLLILIIVAFSLINYSVKKFVTASPLLAMYIVALRSELIVAHVVAFFGASMLYTKSMWATYAIVACVYTIVQSQYVIEPVKKKHTYNPVSNAPNP